MKVLTVGVPKIFTIAALMFYLAIAASLRPSHGDLNTIRDNRDIQAR